MESSVRNTATSSPSLVLVLILLFRPSGSLGEHVSEETIVYKRDF
jgi:hypothetical protein